MRVLVQASERKDGRATVTLRCGLVADLPAKALKLMQLARDMPSDTEDERELAGQRIHKALEAIDHEARRRASSSCTAAHRPACSPRAARH